MDARSRCPVSHNFVKVSGDQFEALRELKRLLALRGQLTLITGMPRYRPPFACCASPELLLQRPPSRGTCLSRGIVEMRRRIRLTTFLFVPDDNRPSCPSA